MVGLPTSLGVTDREGEGEVVPVRRAVITVREGDGVNDGQIVEDTHIVLEVLLVLPGVIRVRVTEEVTLIDVDLVLVTKLVIKVRVCV